MREEIELLSTKIKPLVDQRAQECGIVFEPKSSQFLSQFYDEDETARYLFDSFVAATPTDRGFGGFSIVHAERLESIYSDPVARGKELVENRIFVFATEGDGSFYGFGLESRKFYNFYVADWVAEEAPWNECIYGEWGFEEFCEYFVKEYEINLG